MEAPRSVFANFLNHTQSITGQNSTQPPSGSEIQYAEKEIETAFLLMEMGEPVQAMQHFTDLHQYALSLKGDNPSDAKKIDDKLFEAGLELLLDDQFNTAKEIFEVVMTSPEYNVIGVTHHPEAQILRDLLKLNGFLPSRSEALLSKAACHSERGLKVLPYFLGKICEQGMYGKPIDLTKANQLLQLATERGYEVREKEIEKIANEFILMSEGQQSPASSFQDLPKELINQIALTRMHAVLRQRGLI